MTTSVRGLLGRAARRVIAKIVPLLGPPRTIYDRDGSSPYLSRHYLFGAPRTKEAFDEEGSAREDIVWSKLPVNVYLHHFHRGDDDEALHNHPWSWSLSLILAGGYREEKRGRSRLGPSGDVYERVLLPFQVNLIRGDDFHRVELLEADAWSLFIAGPRASSWGFWDRHTDRFLPWRDYIARRRGIDVSKVPE